MIIHKQRKLKKIEDEIWKEVPGSNNRYQVSNYGRVKSFSLNKDEGKIMKSSTIKGFKFIQLKIDGSIFRYYVHKLVAKVWLNEPSHEQTIVTHLDGNITNNHVSNLKWMSKDELTIQHRELNLQKPVSAKRTKTITNSKLKENDIVLLKTMIQKGVVQAKIAKMFCISEMQVTRIKRGENWGHIKADIVN
jgi:hypothetical protein